jgi:ParB-like chromosome segregation protein Spo0J
MPETEAGTTELGFHPLANLFPLMEGADFDELMQDIRENGLREPICVHECQILDGRNRYMARMVAGVEPRFEAFPVGEDPLAFVISRNLHRRHLTVQQRAAVAAELATMERTDTLKRGPEASNDATGKSPALGRRS